MGSISESISHAIEDANSPVHGSTQWKPIKKYLQQTGKTFTKDDILRVLERKQIHDVKYNNRSEKKIAQVSKSHLQTGSFFSILQSDVLILSKKRRYNTRNAYILGVLCTLSRYLFLESLPSLKFDDHKRAWDRIFERMKAIKPNVQISMIVTDAGSNYVSSDFKSYLAEKNIKLNIVKVRRFRGSHGAPAMESAWRRVRNNLEKVRLMHLGKKPFKETLLKVEKMCNSDFLSSIKMTATDGIAHDPMYLLLRSESERLKRRKQSFKKEEVVPMYTVVQIKINKQKQFSNKESYGVFSDYLIIVGFKFSRYVCDYKVSSLFNFTPIDGSFTRAEMLFPKISFVDACLKQQAKVDSVIRKDSDLVFYRIANSTREFVARNTLINN